MYREGACVTCERRGSLYYLYDTFILVNKYIYTSMGNHINCTPQYGSYSLRHSAA